MVMPGFKYLKFLFLLPLFHIAEAQSPYYNCPSSALNYTTNSTFENNMNRLLTSLTANASLTGFYNTTVGGSPDQVHGLVQCHRDISNEDCSSCAASAASQIVQVCPNKRMAVIWFDNCLLRYNSFNFFGVVDESKLALVNTVGISNPLKFKPIVASLFSNLALSATTTNSSLLYATGSFRYTDNVTIYCLVECTRDLPLNFCNSCLKSSTIQIFQCCSDKQGARILSGSCVIRYEIYPFFGNLLMPAMRLPPPPPSSSSAGSPTNSSGVNGCMCSSGHFYVITVWVSASTALVVSVLCVLLLTRKRTAEDRAQGNRRLLQRSSSKSHLVTRDEPNN